MRGLVARRPITFVYFDGLPITLDGQLIGIVREAPLKQNRRRVKAAAAAAACVTVEGWNGSNEWTNGPNEWTDE